MATTLRATTAPTPTTTTGGPPKHRNQYNPAAASEPAAASLRPRETSMPSFMRGAARGPARLFRSLASLSSEISMLTAAKLTIHGALVAVALAAGCTSAPTSLREVCAPGQQVGCACPGGVPGPRHATPMERGTAH